MKVTYVGAKVRKYRVQPGDTLASIGRLYGIPWQSIANANHLNNTQTLGTGWVLKIPMS